MSEKTWHLKSCRLFEELSEQELRRLELRCLMRRFPPKTSIYLPADEANGVMFLVSGRVKLGSYTSEGKQAILTFIEPGEFFGELALFDPDCREEFAEAVMESAVVLIPSDALHEVMGRHASVSLGVSKMIGFRRRRIERRLKYLLFRSNRERLSHLLLELAEQYGRRTEGGVEIGISLTHQELANIIGSTRETVTVVLGEMQSEGLIRFARRRITLADVNLLADTIHAARPQIELEQSIPAARLGG